MPVGLLPKARTPPLPGQTNDYDDSSRSDSSTTARSSSFIAKRASPPTSTSSDSPRSSGSHTAAPSRSQSPLPQAYPSGLHSHPPPWSSDSEPGEPLLGWAQRNLRHRGDRPRWWATDEGARRRRRRDGWYLIFRRFMKNLRRGFRHPCIPSQPLTILMTTLLFLVFAISITLLVMHILNPDKEPLPWRAYCSVPSPYSSPHYPHLPTSSSALPHTASLYAAPFPPDNLETLAPIGLFVGIFSMDSYFERRMLIRTTWASHPRSRDGAGQGDGGSGTSRTIVRFILGQPRKGDWERRIKLEMETYNDIIILPIQENMNSGKTHAYFSWASDHAWVPPLPDDSPLTQPATFSYSDLRGHAPIPAEHDPRIRTNTSWVRPDYVVKCDDDSFVMLAELEARLRVELHTTGSNLTDKPTFLTPWSDPMEDDASSIQAPPSHSPSPSPTDTENLPVETTTTGAAPRAVIPLASTYSRAPPPVAPPPPSHPPSALDDPLIYWGYLIKNKFMGGELYALSWALVDWVATDPGVKGRLHGAEDKQTAKWMNAHPRAHEIRWKSERCWMYDHPRAGTVYSHGFLFPSEVTRVQRSIMSYLGKTAQDILASPWVSAIGVNAPTPSQWAHSSVATFGTRYALPISNLTTVQSVEAMVEGSAMSMVQDGSPMTAEYAWTHREGRRKRYDGARVGGTVVVHFIKKHMWFLEAALALLEGDEVTEFERAEELIGLGKTRPPATVLTEDAAVPVKDADAAALIKGADAAVTDDGDADEAKESSSIAGEKRAKSPWAKSRKHRGS